MQNLPPNVRRSYAALAERCDVHVSRTTVWYLEGKRPSRQTKTEHQQYQLVAEHSSFTSQSARETDTLYLVCSTYDELAIT